MIVRMDVDQVKRSRRAWDGFTLKIPALGELFRKAAISRFASTLATLLES